jgi:hypothetical protein
MYNTKNDFLLYSLLIRCTRVHEKKQFCLACPQLFFCPAYRLRARVARLRPREAMLVNRLLPYVRR